MEPHVERMLHEQEELTDKLIKLGSFITENPIFDTLSNDEQSDMYLQLQTMSMYNTILTRRIERAKEKEENNKD